MRHGGVQARIEWILVAMFLLGSAALFGVVGGKEDRGVTLGDGSPLACYQPWHGRSMTSLLAWMPQQSRCRLSVI
jgi:hypothetical protein